MNLGFRRGGREVSLDQFMDGLKQDAVDLASDTIEKRVWATRCPVHGSAPTAVRQVGNRENPKWEVDGCCQRLQNEIGNAF